MSCTWRSWRLGGSRVFSDQGQLTLLLPPAKRGREGDRAVGRGRDGDPTVREPPGVAPTRQTLIVPEEPSDERRWTIQHPTRTLAC